MFHELFGLFVPSNTEQWRECSADYLTNSHSFPSFCHIAVINIHLHPKLWVFHNILNPGDPFRKAVIQMWIIYLFIFLIQLIHH